MIRPDVAVTRVQIEDVLKRERFAEARRLLESGALVGESPASVLALHAQALAGLAEFDDAVRLARESLALDPAQAKAHVVLGAVAEAFKSPQDAVQHYAAAIHADPGCAAAYHALGLLMLAGGQHDAASQALRRAYSLDPENWRYAAGVALLEPPRKRAIALRAAYRQGVAQQPRSLGLRLRLLGTYPAAALAPVMGSGARANGRLGYDAYRVLMSRPVVITYILLAINVAMYVFLETHGGSQDNATLDRFGAKDSAAIVHQGQWWRLITPMFLHAGLTHLMVNGISLYFVGSLYERAAGRSRFLYVYFFAGVGGSLFSLAESKDLAVGASGAIFGIFGALGVFFFLHRGLFGGIASSLVKQVVILSAVNLLLPNLVAGIDGWAHLGGLLTGMAAAAIAGPYLPPPGTAGSLDQVLVERRPRAIVVSAMICAALVLIAVAALVIHLNPAGA